MKILIVFWLCVVLHICWAINCTSETDSNRMNAKRFKYSDGTFKFTQVLNTYVHPTSGKIYRYIGLENQTDTTLSVTIEVEDASGSVNLAGFIRAPHNIYGFAVMEDQSSIFFLFNPNAEMKLMEIDVNTRLLTNEWTVSASIATSIGKIKTHDGIIYVSGQSDGLDMGVVCVIDPSVVSSCSCARFVDTNSGVLDFIVLSDSEVFAIVYHTLNQYLYYIKYNKDITGLVVWTTRLACINSVCSASHAESVLSEDSTIIYTAVLFGDYNIVAALNESTGSLVETQYTHELVSNWLAISEMQLYKNKLYILHYNSAVTNNAFISLLDMGRHITRSYGIASLSTLNTFYIQGDWIYLGGHYNQSGLSQYGYRSRSPADSVGRNYDMTYLEQSYIVNSSLPFSFGHNDVSMYLATGVGLSKVGEAWDTNFPSSTPLDSPTTDLSYFEEDLGISIFSGSSQSESIEYTCSVSGSPPISYSIVFENQTTGPEWFTISPESGTYSVEAPVVDSDTNYTLMIYASNTVSYSVRYVYLTVFTCNVDNCDTCSEHSGIVCDKCKSLFVLSQDKLVCNDAEMSDALKAAQMVTAVSTGVGVSASMSISLMTLTSPQAAFSMLNQLQLLLLFPLVGSFMPDDIILFIEGMDFTSFSFGFMSVSQVSSVERKILKLTDKTEDEYLQRIGLEYKSTLFNQISLLQVILILLSIHCLLHLLVNGCKLSHSEKWVSKFLTKCYQSFKYSVYIRLLLEVFLILVLSNAQELYLAETSSVKQVALYTVSAGIAVFVICKVVFVFALWVKNRDKEEIEPSFEEYFRGLKPNFQSRVFPVNFLLKRVLLISIVSTMGQAPVISRAISFSIVQILGTVGTTFTNPFEETRDSVIEVINEIFLSACTILICVTEETGWNQALEWVFLSLIISGNLLVTLILSIILARVTWAKIKGCRKDKYTISVKEIKRTKTGQREKAGDVSKSAIELKAKREETKFEQFQKRDPVERRVSHNISDLTEEEIAQRARKYKDLADFTLREQMKKSPRQVMAEKARKYKQLAEFTMEQQRKQSINKFNY